jgi:uncharacterized protein YigE (DUF2233 family)
LASLEEQIEKFGQEVKERYNELRISHVYKEHIPRYLQIPDGIDMVVINPQNDMNNYKEQPRGVMLMSDILALIHNQKKTKKRRFTKQGTERE